MVQSVAIDGIDLEIQLEDDCEDSSFVMSLLAENKTGVKSIQEREINLEDIFMKITEGSVQ